MCCGVVCGLAQRVCRMLCAGCMQVLLLLRARTGVVFSGSSSETHSLVAFAAAAVAEVEEAAAAGAAEAEAEGAGDLLSQHRRILTEPRLLPSASFAADSNGVRELWLSWEASRDGGARPESRRGPPIGSPPPAAAPLHHHHHHYYRRGAKCHHSHPDVATTRTTSGLRVRAAWRGLASTAIGARQVAAARPRALLVHCRRPHRRRDCHCDRACCCLCAARVALAAVRCCCRCCSSRARGRALAALACRCRREEARPAERPRSR